MYIVCSNENCLIEAILISTHNLPFSIQKKKKKKRKSPKIILNLQLREVSKGLKNEFETVVVNEPSMFEPLKVYCD